MNDFPRLWGELFILFTINLKSFGGQIKMMKQIKTVFVLMLALIAIMAVGVSAADLNVSYESVKLDGDTLYDAVTNQVDRDSTYDVRVRIYANEDLENAEITAKIYGVDSKSDSVSDTTEVFDLPAGQLESFDLSLDLPAKMDRDEYTLRITVSDRNNNVEYEFPLAVSTSRNSVVIKDVSIFPGNGVIAGQSVTAVVNVKNYGQLDEDDVQINFEIVGVGSPAHPVYMDLESEESDSSDELYVRVPSTTVSGVYNAVVTISYDDGDEEVVQSGKIEIFGADVKVDEKETAKVLVTVGAQSQEVVAGESGAIYPITFANTGDVAKTYSVSVTGTEQWADVRVSPSNTVTVKAGETKQVFVYVAANEAAVEGQRAFSVNIHNSDMEVVKQIPMSASVTEGDEAGWDAVKKGLQVGLIILVVILVILGLIVAFNRMKNDEDEDDEDDELAGQTYY